MLTKELSAAPSRSAWEDPPWLTPSQALTRFRLSGGLAPGQSGSRAERVRYGFRVGSLNFLVEPQTVSEVIAMVPIAAIPNASPWLLGMINLRGNLVPVFDLAMLCALDAPGDDPGRWILVLDRADHAVGLLIDGQPQAVRNMTPLETLPSLPTALRGSVSGGFMADQEVWLDFDHRTFFRSISQVAASGD